MPNLYESILHAFEPILEEKKFKKGTAVHQPNKTCNHLFLVQSGLLRAYYYKEGKDITAHFALENGSITAPDSFISRRKSKYTIEALEDSNVLAIEHSILEKYLVDRPELEHLARKYTEFIYMELLERLEGLVFLTAKEKYHLLIKDNPTIIQRVNLGHIASYLNITQETLSRVRKMAT